MSERDDLSLAGAAGKDSRERTRLSAFLTQLLVVPVAPGFPVSGSSGRWVLGALVLHAVADGQGRMSVTAFTSDDELLRWRPELKGSQCFGVVGATLLEAFLKTDYDRIVVDRASPAAFAIDRYDAQALLDATPTVADDAPRIMIGPPDRDATRALVAQLRAICAALPGIIEAHLCRTQPLEHGLADSSSEPQLVLTAVYREGTERTVLGDAVDTILNAVRAAAANQPGGFPPFRVETTTGVQSEVLDAMRRKGIAVA
jgi:SseB protein N-terminal domain